MDKDESLKGRELKRAKVFYCVWEYIVLEYSFIYGDYVVKIDTGHKWQY